MSNNNKINEVIEEFSKLFYETEDLALKQGIKCLTHTELHVIEAIDRDSLTMNELSDRLGITMGTATVTVSKLSDKGFIKRDRSDLDRRKVFVTLSQKGIEALSYHNNYHNMIITSITQNINPKEMDVFIKVFEEILYNLKSKVEYFKPGPVIDFPRGSLVNVVEIKGSPIVQNFFKDKGIEPYTTLKVVNNNHRTLIVEGENNIPIELNIMDAKNLVVVKKEI